MKNLNKAISILMCIIMFFSVSNSSLGVISSAKNTVKTTISKVEPKAKAFKITYERKSKIKGYQIQYSTSSKFSKSYTKTKTITSAKTTTVTVNNLKGCNVTYYVRVRTYKIVDGERDYSSWSSTKKVTTLNHKYSTATCTEAKTCSRCDKTSGEALGHKWRSATCTKPKTCTRCDKTRGEALGHKYSAATCTKPKTCTRCDRTRGEALGHKYSAATCTKPKTCTRCDRTRGEALGHMWSAATCTEPKICDRCDKTSGVALGHKWSAATCTKPKTCDRCDKASGVALGHEWSSATCTEPKTCNHCGTTSGAALGHDYNEGMCSRCGGKDSNYVKTYTVGETWVVDDQWEITINSVTTHNLCNSYSNDRNGYTNEQVILIDYTYKNLGYTGSYQDLFISSASFDVYDETGEASRTYACTHRSYAKECVVGTRCTAQEAYVLSNDSSEITLVIEHYTSNGTGKQKATFKLPVY